MRSLSNAQLEYITNVETKAGLTQGSVRDSAACGKVNTVIFQVQTVSQADVLQRQKDEHAIATGPFLW